MYVHVHELFEVFIFKKKWNLVNSIWKKKVLLSIFIQIGMKMIL